MKSWQTTAAVISGLLMLVLCAGAYAQVQPQKQGGGVSAGKQTETFTVKGKIGYLKKLGGYYVESVEPPSTIMIDNQNPPVLKKLKKSGTIVTIEGRQTYGADHMVIDKIDGKKYSGKK